MFVFPCRVYSALPLTFKVSLEAQQKCCIYTALLPRQLHITREEHIFSCWRQYSLQVPLTSMVNWLASWSSSVLRSWLRTDSSIISLIISSLAWYPMNKLKKLPGLTLWQFYTCVCVCDPQKYWKSSNKNLYMNVIAALFTVARRWKQPKGPSAEEWINRMWCICKTEYYPAI